MLSVAPFGIKNKRRQVLRPTYHLIPAEDQTVKPMTLKPNSKWLSSCKDGCFMQSPGFVLGHDGLFPKV